MLLQQAKPIIKLLLQLQLLQLQQQLLLPLVINTNSFIWTVHILQLSHKNNNN